jgi:hypothetical protein
MMFGRVEATAEPTEQPEAIRLTVYLETGQRIQTVRTGIVPVLRSIACFDDLAWHADQYAQETIANELALEGWEVIGGGEIPASEPGALARSASYAVRRLYYTEPQ